MNTQITHNNNGVGNTILPHQNKRNWCFTLNNYTESDITQILMEKHSKNCKQFCFQEEKGENEIPHLQGVIAYTNARSFSRMKKFLPRAHWGVCKDLKASLIYCSKEPTRVGRTFTHNYKVVKMWTDEEFAEWEKKDIQSEVDKVLKSMKGMTLTV